MFGKEINQRDNLGDVGMFFLYAKEKKRIQALRQRVEQKFIECRERESTLGPLLNPLYAQMSKAEGAEKKKLKGLLSSASTIYGQLLFANEELFEMVNYLSSSLSTFNKMPRFLRKGFIRDTREYEEYIEDLETTLRECANVEGKIKSALV